MKKTFIIFLILTLTVNLFANLTGTEGLAIDLSSAGAGTDFTIAFDATELDAVTWSDGANASNIWTFDVSGTDVTLTFGNALMTITGGLTITTGKPLTLGVVRWDNGSDLIDGEQIANDTIDNDSIDWADMTDLTTDGAVSWGNIAEGELANSTVVGADIKDDTIDSADYAADSIDNEHINWADIDNLGDEGAVTLAATVTVSDDENTDDDQEVVFTTDNATLESDGDFHYSPDTGTVTATEFVGGGAGVTSVDAITGDSATAFFDAGTIEHEYGGLEADISSYTGVIAITGGSTAEVDSKSELEGHIADVADFAEADGDTYTGAHDFGGATSIEIVNAADPDVDAAGEITQDTDGGNETGDVSIRGFDGANQFLVAKKLKTLNFTLISPDTIDAADLIPVWHNTSGFTFTIVEWKAWSDDDDVSLEIEELTDQTDYTARTQVDAVEIATDGTGVFYASDGTITHAAIEHDHSIAIDFDATDTPDYVQIAITGWYNSDVD